MELGPKSSRLLDSFFAGGLAVAVSGETPTSPLRTKVSNGDADVSIAHLGALYRSSGCDQCPITLVAFVGHFGKDSSVLFCSLQGLQSSLTRTTYLLR